MLEIYWSCFIFGVVIALIIIIFDDIFNGAFESFAVGHLDFLQPVAIVGCITIFGGMGVLLSVYTTFGDMIIILSFLTAVLLSILLYFAYIRPMKNCANSTSFSRRDLIGKIGEVTVPIPVGGYGEVFIRIGAGNTNQIAASCDQSEIPAGTRVTITDVRQETIYVLRYNVNK